MDKPKKSNTLIWAIIFVIGAVMLIGSLLNSRTGQVWVTEEHHAFVESGVTDAGVATYTTSTNGSTGDIEWTTYNVVPESELTQQAIDSGEATLSWSRTIGLWLAAMFTLFILSFLVGDNPAYKFAESMVVGTSAGYVMVIGLWDVFVPNLMGKLMPTVVQSWALPGMSSDFVPFWWMYFIPAILIIMLLFQLMPAGGWISRWPIAFFIGITAGYRMIGYVEADLVAQIKAGIVPLWITGEGGFEFWPTFNACLLTIATLSAMVYFFFSQLSTKALLGKLQRSASGSS